jgi:hypothetical protein
MNHPPNAFSEERKEGSTGKYWMNKVKSSPAVHVLTNCMTMSEDAQRLEIFLKQQAGHL